MADPEPIRSAARAYDRHTQRLGLIGVLAMGIFLTAALVAVGLSIQNSTSLAQHETQLLRIHNQLLLKHGETIRDLQRRVLALDHALSLVCVRAHLPCPAPLPGATPSPRTSSAPPGAAQGSASGSSAPTPAPSPRPTPTATPRPTPTLSPTPTPTVCLPIIGCL